MGFFDKIKQGLTKTKNSFTEKIESIVKSFKKIDEDFFEQLEEMLILSDLGAQTAMDICDELRTRTKKQGVNEPEAAIALMKEIVAEILDGGNELDLSAKPAVLLVIGVNGAGKTTSVGKLAHTLKSQGKKVIVAAADTFRAAAIEQLHTWTDRAGVELIKQSEGSDPAAVVYDSCRAAVARDADVLIIDTAGRLHNKKNLMDELRKISRIVTQQLPESSVETLLVLDATTGQNAVSQARLFGEVADISGIVLTKLDGTAKGGIIISIKNELDIPVKFIGVGEKLEDLEPFSAESYADELFSGFTYLPQSDEDDDNADEEETQDDTGSIDE